MKMCKFRYSLIAVTLVTSVTFSKAQESERRLTSYVNPFIGTGAVESSLSGNNFPAAIVPFGMVQLGPDTQSEPDWAQASGYDYRDKTIAGFSHTRLSGTGAADLFDILLMPTTGDVKTVAGNPSDTGSGYMSKFSHDDETAKPGYYQVRLSDYDINVELTASTRAGFHSYTYPKGSDGHIVLDLDHSRHKGSWGTKVINSQIKIVDEYTVEGYRVITGWAKLRKIYFYAKFSKPILRNVLVDGGTEYKNNRVVNGTNLRAVLDFDTNDGKPLLVKIGLSPVSIANAHNNLDTEIPHWEFNRTLREAENLWEQELSKIKIDATETQKEIFYTAVYHAYTQPYTFSDVNGDYMRTDYTGSNVGKDGGVHYTTFSLWDTYRAAHPLYTITQPERSTDFVKSMIRQYETYGYLPIWQLWGQDNYCMIGNHSIPVIVDAVLKGMKGIDPEKAYEAVRNSSLTPHPNSPFEVWDKYGYMPENIQSQSVSISLEMAFDDWCVAQLAKKLGKTEDYNRFMKRAQYYKNLYNAKTSFFQSKDDKGNWMEPFDPYKHGANGGYPFTEGNAWQYFWYVPHDVYQLINMVGGDTPFSKKMDDFFSLDDESGAKNDNISGLIGQYAHGNEPSHHVAYLYNYSGQPSKTQYYTNRVMNEMYNNSFSGYAGNEDCGQMASWYVFSAMGFYPVNPASGVYVIGSPLVESAVIQLPSGKSFTVRAPKKFPEEIYIQSVMLNGKKYDNSYIAHSDIMKGGVLEFKMGKKPSKWGVKPENRPPDNGYN